jgi:phage tail sheath protein FI
MALSEYHSSAGVYTTEYDLSAPVPNAGNATIAAIVGASTKGPVLERTLISNTQEFIAIFGQPNPTVSMMHYSALTFLEESGILYVTRVVGTQALTAGAYLTVDDPAAAIPLLALTVFDDTTATPLGVVDPLNNPTMNFVAGDIANDNQLLFFAAANPGTWNNTLAVQVRPANAIGTTVGTNHDPYDFYVDVYVDYTGTSNRPVETFLVNRNNKVDGYGIQLFVEDVINRKSKYIRVKNNPYCAPVRIMESAFCFFDGGANGNAPTEAALIKGWKLYSDVEQLNLGLLINGGYATPLVQQAMVDLAASRKDCVAILDIPSDLQSPSDATTYRTETLNIDSSYAAIYTPDVQIRDPYNDLDIFVPLSGFAAAVCARTDKNAKLWNAPAGLNRGVIDVINVRHLYDKEDRDSLDAVGINMLRRFPTIGDAFWAQNTMQIHASATSNLNVRRLMNYMEKAASNKALYSVFESNTALLRLKLKTLIVGFLQPIKAGEGILDYEVICDDTNNPVSRIASGDVNLDIFIDPALPAKRIHINATITKTGALFVASNSNTTASGLATR